MKKDKKRLTKKEVTQRLLALFEASPERSFTVKELFSELRAGNHPAKMLVLDTLDTLVFDDYVSSDGKGHYRGAPQQHILEGTFKRKRNGYNSFIPDDSDEPILVSERNALHALDGDRVQVAMMARRRGHEREAEVIAILERSNDTFVGRLKVEKNYAFLITPSRVLANDIFIPTRNLKGGKTGDKVVVKIVEWPMEAKSPIGKVVDILGQEGENDAEMNAILAEFNLPYTYPKRVVEAADKIPDGVTAEEVARREDMRDVLTFTIDPRDAKDFDDALSIRTLADGAWEVGVHIADVTAYVHEGDIIDREALKRATSIYLVDRTIPMLPERLSNQLCSLRQDEDKLAYSVIFKMNDAGEVLDWHLAHTVIRSDRRFVYEEVQYILEQNGEASAEDLATPGEHPKVVKGTTPVGEYAAQLITLNRLAKQLRSKRFKHGAIGFDRPEIRFEIDDKGHPVSTFIRLAKDANKLVEEFMLLANRTVAEHIGRVARGKKAKVFPYRIHDVPDPEKLITLSGFIAKFGYKIRTEGSKKDVSKSLNRLLEDVKGKKEQGMVEMVTLRAMAKARYSIENIGHYGLMFDYYAHFTSPIRRYPDMMVHRLLTRYAEGGRSVSASKYEELCEHSSAMEQLAETAERASTKYKQVEFMADRLGQEFEGIIDGVTEFGLYVELEENGCEGMIPIRNLSGDYYDFDERNFCLIGRRHRKRYALGDKLRIRVDKANLERRTLDFMLADDELPPAPRPTAFASDKRSQKKKKNGRKRK